MDQALQEKVVNVQYSIISALSLSLKKVISKYA